MQQQELYQLIQSIPLDLQNFESLEKETIEIAILWGSSILHVSHLKPEESFYFGNDINRNCFIAPCVTDIPIPIIKNGKFYFRGSCGFIENKGKKKDIDSLVSNNLVSENRIVEIKPDFKYSQEIYGLTINVRLVCVAKEFTKAIKRDSLLTNIMLGTSFMALLGIIGINIATQNDRLLSSTNEDDRMMELRAFINHQEERQTQQQVPQTASQQQETLTAGAAHVGREGKMGSRTAPNLRHRYAIENHGVAPQLSNRTARETISTRGVFLALNGRESSTQGGSSGIVSPFGHMIESGLDNRNANGNMDGLEIGDSFGYDGLGRLGSGWGGGGTHENAIGVGDLNTLGRNGRCNGEHCGNTPYGLSQGNHMAQRMNHGPTVRARPPEIIGLLSPEAIRRVVLRNIGQVNHCYEQGLAINSTLTGRIIVRFVIGGTGGVMGVSITESTLSIPSVSECISNATRRWQFPPPDGAGVVTVNYPFTLQPAD